MRVLVLALVLFISGCVSAPSEPASAPQGDALAGLVAPPVDGGRAREWWDVWVNAHPMRLAGSPTNIQASEEIAAALAEAGYETSVVYYVPRVGESPAPAGIRTIIGVKEGKTQPDHVIAWLAHYDSASSTIYAAYDDGSGTATTLEVARALASYDNEKTLMAIFFDGEEEGLVASQAFVQDVTNDPSKVFDLVIGLDMTGINCPGHEWPLYAQPGQEHADAIVPVLMDAYAKAGFDVGAGEDARNCIVLLEANDRSSDENAFRSIGIPVVRFSGGRNAGDYPQYHMPGDTTDFVYQYMGSPENVEKGLAAAASVAAWTVMAFDRTPANMTG